MARPSLTRPLRSLRPGTGQGSVFAFLRICLRPRLRLWLQRAACGCQLFDLTQYLILVLLCFRTWGGCWREGVLFVCLASFCLFVAFVAWLVSRCFAF